MVMADLRKRPVDEQERFIAPIAETAERMGMGLVVLRMDGDQVSPIFANALLREMVGAGDADVGTIDFSKCFSADGLQQMLELVACRRRGDLSPRVIETAVLHQKSLEPIPVEMFSSVWEQAGQQFIVAFFRDIRSRKEAEEKLRRSEERFRLLVENAPDGIVILRGTRILYINPIAAAMLGIERARDGVGRDMTDLLLPEQGAVMRQRIDRAQASGEPLRDPAVYRFHDPSARLRHVEVRAIPIDYEGQPAVLGFARDVTERLAMQAKLIESDRLASIGTLAAGVAHEINNPLAYLLINLEQIGRKLVPTDGRATDRVGLAANLEYAREGAERIGKIVHDLQTYARPTEGALAPVDLREVLSKVLSFSAYAMESKAKVVCDYRDASVVRGNAQRLEQLFLNLLLNAADAIEVGRPEKGQIAVSVLPGDPEKVIVEVRDSGCGIPEAELPRIFDPFFTTKPPGKGTGLGLFICRSIVESLRGSIEVQSRVGEGTTFRVVLNRSPG